MKTNKTFTSPDWINPGAVDIVCISNHIYTLKYVSIVHIHSGRKNLSKKAKDGVKKKDRNVQERMGLIPDLSHQSHRKPITVYYYFLFWLWSFKT